MEEKNAQISELQERSADLKEAQEEQIWLKKELDNVTKVLMEQKTKSTDQERKLNSQEKQTKLLESEVASLKS